MLDWLIEAREKQDMSKTELSKAVGVDISAIGKYERGERRPSVEKAKEIANTLGFDWRLFYPDEPANDQTKHQGGHDNDKD